MREQIIGKTFDEERALYYLQNADVVDCTFAGPADGRFPAFLPTAGSASVPGGWS